MFERIDLKHARDALHAIDPGCSRDDWHSIGRAAIAAGLSVDDLNEWSRSASNYTSERDVRAAFRGIEPNGKTGPGTLWKAALSTGWRPPEDADKAKAGRNGTKPPRKPPARPVEALRPPRPGMSAAEVWARCKAAPASHGYIDAKQGRADGLRVVPEGDPLCITGMSVVGWLVVPVLPLAGGAPASLQFIPPPGAGKKLNLPDAPMTGAFIVGELAQAGTAYLCEGIGQAWACWKATGAAAVVCFGWGRVRAVAEELRQRDGAARLVLVPDAGKEADAEKIAREVAGFVAKLPTGLPINSDVNDYALKEGADALEVLLAEASKPDVPVHPLAQFVELDAAPQAPRWVIPGFIGHGVVIVAGAHGVGKTTALLPLAMVAAGLHARGDPLAPREWRHVVYIVEDIEQARRILAGILGSRGPGLDIGTVRQRLHMVEARRLEPAIAVAVGKTYREKFTRTVDGVEVLPLVVVDTKAAVLVMEEENSNSESSEVMAAFKQDFEGLPTWLVGHVAKANMTRADAAGLSLRGGSAFEADANQVLYLVKEADGTRYLVRGKTRFEAKWPELIISSDYTHTTAPDEFGNVEPVTLRWGIASPPEMTRREAQEQAKEAARKDEAAALREDTLNAVQTAWQTGFPLNREGVKAKLPRNRNEVTDTIENLLSERWLVEVAVPPKERTNPKRSAFLVALTPHEHDGVVLRKEPVPAAKLTVPPSWRKPAAPSVSDAQPQEGREDADDPPR